MKLLFILIFSVLFFACGQKQEQQSASQFKQDTSYKLPEFEKKMRFVAFINEYSKNMEEASLVNWFDGFCKQYYPGDSLSFKNYGKDAYLYYACSEELINPKNIEGRKWFRLLVSPSFERTFSFTIEKHSDCYRLTYNLYGHTYSQIPDHLMFSYCDQSFDTTKYNTFFTMLADNGFMQKTSHEQNTHILHPISFYFEAIDNNKYNRFERFGYDFETKEDLGLMRESLNLIRNSNIYPVLKKLYPPDGNESSDNPYEFIETLAKE